MKCLVLLMMLFLASVVHAAITIDGTPTISGGTGDFGSDSFSHTTAADANILLVCTGSSGASGGNNTVNSVSYNSLALTSLVSATGGDAQQSRWWYRLAPSTGANLVAVTPLDDPWYINVAISLKGVLQAAPTHVQGANATGDTPTVTLTSALGELALDCGVLASSTHTATVGAGQTQLVNSSHDNIGVFLSSEPGASPNVTLSWGLETSYFWASSGVSLEPTVGAGRRRFPGWLW